MDVAELPDANLPPGLGVTTQPTMLQPSDVSYAVPEEDSSASAGSPTVVVPRDSLQSDNVPLMDQSDSASESELEMLVTPRRVPARYDVVICVFVSVL